jgi:hypothetical protein
MHIDLQLSPSALQPALARFFGLSAGKIEALQRSWDPSAGSPVITRAGVYTAQGWTEWTQGFQFGCQALQFDATGETAFLEAARQNTVRFMAPHVSHTGVHDHGFNNISTYGNLRRLALEGRFAASRQELDFWELALKISGAVQAARWSRTQGGPGYIYSFNGPQSLFSDTVRSVRALVVAHKLGHCLMGEGDRRISLLGRAIEHLRTTAQYNVYFGEGRDAYDVPGRVVHESIFNVNDGAYRCPSTQQGYSPFSTWTRGLAWIILGYAEELEAFRGMEFSEIAPFYEPQALLALLERTARVTADYYIAQTALDGIPYWDTGAPGLAQLPGWRDQPAQIDNPHEPVDSSAAAIAAQGLLRLGRVLGLDEDGRRYWQAGLTVARTLLAEPYLSTAPEHQGLLLHSVYHQPRGWDVIPAGKRVPQGESSMWGDYHAMELAVYLQRIINGGHYLSFTEIDK